MGKIGMSGGGSSADLDVITAGAGDVLAGKVIVDKDGNPLTGTMPNRGAVNQSLAINGSYTIPRGYHNGSGKVSQSIPTQGAKTITPGASQQQVAAGRYLTGAITVPGFSMPAANLIKKGAKITIYGRSVTGTWEGYVTSPTDLYYKGTNSAGFSVDTASLTDFEFQGTQLIVSSHTTSANSGSLISNRSYNFSGYGSLNIQFGGSTEIVHRAANIELRRNSEDGVLVDKYDQEYNDDPKIEGKTTWSFSLSNSQMSFKPYIVFKLHGGTAYIERIWID